MLPRRPASHATRRSARVWRLAALTLAAHAALALAAHPAHAQPVLPTGFSDQVVVSGLSSPIALAFLPDGRALVAEYHVPDIRCIRGGTFAPGDPAANFDDIRTDQWENGLLGMAVDPGWPQRPYLYILCGDRASATLRISRYAGSGDLTGGGDGSLQFSTATRYDVLTGIPCTQLEHHAGTLRFGLDGMLYASIGDDSQPCNAQDPTIATGKILRLDVSRLPAGAGGPPAVSLIAPPDNPYAGSSSSVAKLVWADGLRNPFRFAVSPIDGALMVADVGDVQWEEVDRIAGGGRNEGWPVYEGPAVYGDNCGVQGDGPVWSYPHPGITAAIIGGPVYAAPAGATAPFPPPYRGDAFYSDFYSGVLVRLHFDGTRWTRAAPVPGQPDTLAWAEGYPEIADWLVGPDGALWYARFSVDNVANQGYVGRIVAAPGTALPAVSANAPALMLAVPEPSPTRAGARVRFALPRAQAVR
ncbi:MAG TPA: PQQ-dependent sugar dehydrogenase, partial [Candidatus Eisenbacteria bacterium]|nr:PQQ-dependent sugar dehydrogenase [Candidatus Eisenbacteria bacterium]